MLTGALGMTEDDISHLNGLDYARTAEEARARVDAGEADAAFFMAPTPVDRGPRRRRGGREHAARSRPTSIPKVLTGMVFNPLEERWP